MSIGSPEGSTWLRVVGLGCLLALSVVGFAAAGPFEDAYAATHRGDYATALRLWRPLADRGDALAQNQIGWMFERGYGVPQDYVQAHMWYNLAAAGSADQLRDQAAQFRDELAAKMTPAQIAEAQKMARE
jgi:TPR repeat protein